MRTFLIFISLGWSVCYSQNVIIEPITKKSNEIWHLNVAYDIDNKFSVYDTYYIKDDTLYSSLTKRDSLGKEKNIVTYKNGSFFEQIEIFNDTIVYVYNSTLFLISGMGTTTSNCGIFNSDLSYSIVSGFLYFITDDTLKKRRICNNDTSGEDKFQLNITANNQLYDSLLIRYSIDDGFFKIYLSSINSMTEPKVISFGVEDKKRDFLTVDDLRFIGMLNDDKGLIFSSRKRDESYVFFENDRIVIIPNEIISVTDVTDLKGNKLGVIRYKGENNINYRYKVGNNLVQFQSQFSSDVVKIYDEE